MYLLLDSFKVQALRLLDQNFATSPIPVTLSATQRHVLEADVLSQLDFRVKPRLACLCLLSHDRMLQHAEAARRLPPKAKTDVMLRACVTGANTLSEDQ